MRPLTCAANSLTYASSSSFVIAPPRAKQQGYNELRTLAGVLVCLTSALILGFAIGTAYSERGRVETEVGVDRCPPYHLSIPEPVENGSIGLRCIPIDRPNQVEKPHLASV